MTGDDELLTWLILYGKERIIVDGNNAEIAYKLDGLGYVDGFRASRYRMWFELSSTGLHRLNQLSKQNKKLGVVK